MQPDRLGERGSALAAGRARAVSPACSSRRYGTAILPRSCTSPARRSRSCSVAGSPRREAARPARVATVREWQPRRADLRSAKSLGGEVLLVGAAAGVADQGVVHGRQRTVSPRQMRFSPDHLSETALVEAADPSACPAGMSGWGSSYGRNQSRSRAAMRADLVANVAARAALERGDLCGQAHRLTDVRMSLLARGIRARRLAAPRLPRSIGVDVQTA